MKVDEELMTENLGVELVTPTLMRQEEMEDEERQGETEIRHPSTKKTVQKP